MNSNLNDNDNNNNNNNNSQEDASSEIDFTPVSNISEFFTLIRNHIDQIYEINTQYQENAMLQRAIQLSNNTPQPIIKHIIDNDFLLNIETYIFDSSNDMIDDDKICPISQDEYMDGDEIMCLPCQHRYLKKNIVTWLENESATCPICRYKMPHKEKLVRQCINNNNTDEGNDSTINDNDINDNDITTSEDESSEIEIINDYSSSSDEEQSESEDENESESENDNNNDNNNNENEMNNQYHHQEELEDVFLQNDVPEIIQHHPQPIPQLLNSFDDFLYNFRSQYNIWNNHS